MTETSLPLESSGALPLRILFPEEDGPSRDGSRAAAMASPSLPGTPRRVSVPVPRATVPCHSPFPSPGDVLTPHRSPFLCLLLGGLRHTAEVGNGFPDFSAEALPTEHRGSVCAGHCYLPLSFLSGEVGSPDRERPRHRVLSDAAFPDPGEEPCGQEERGSFLKNSPCMNARANGVHG